MINQKCKGARDLLPKDTEAFRYIEDVFRKACLSWGYQEVRTPTLEYLHLFTAAGTLTPNMLSKVYSFLDWDGWSGERVVLRPDGTIPVARLYIENLPQNEIARLFYVTNVFAFEETGKENRERWQCGVELMGSDKPASDIELILLAVETIRQLGVSDIQIQLSHAGVLNALLKELKLSSDEEIKLLDQILDGNWQVLTEAKPKNSEINRLVSLFLDLKGKPAVFWKTLRLCLRFQQI
jgi:histidyl-tRNA synthetase